MTKNVAAPRRISMKKLHGDPDALIMTRLSWALNDMSKVQYLHELRSDNTPLSEKQKSLNYFTGSYLSMLLISHLVEGVTTLNDIQDSKTLQELIAGNSHLEKLWTGAKRLLPKGDLSTIVKIYARLRGNIVFHYSEGAELKKGFDKSLEDQPHWASEYYTATSEEPTAYYKFGDDLLDACFLRAYQEDYPGETYQQLAEKLALQRDEILSLFCQFGCALSEIYLSHFEC